MNEEERSLLSGWRDELLYKLSRFGARPSHRHRLIWFDEKNIVFQVDTMTDPQSGFSVGDIVTVDYLHLTPWRSSPNGEDYDPPVKAGTFSNTVFRILAFAKVTGKVVSCHIEGTFCVLTTRGFCNQGGMEICQGQELHQERGKINLYWVGALERYRPPTV